MRGYRGGLIRRLATGLILSLVAAGCGGASHSWSLGNCEAGCPYEGAQAKSATSGGPFSAWAGDDCTQLSTAQIAQYVKGQLEDDYYNGKLTAGFPGMSDLPWISANVVNDCQAQSTSGSGPLYLIPAIWATDSQAPNKYGGGP